MSIMTTLFGTKPAAPAPVTPVAPVAGQPPVAQAVPPQQGNIPAAPTIAVNPDGTPVVDALPVEKDESPLAVFKSLWEDAPIDPNAPATPAGYVAPTADQIQTAVAKQDFSSNFTPEQLAAVTAGGEGASEALVQLLNTVGQQTLAQSTMINSKLNEQAMTAAIAEQVAKMPDLVRAQTVQAHLKDTNPLFDNPAIKPVIEATQHQLQVKFPNATPAEITKMTQDFVIGMGAEFAPKPVVATGLEADDWTNFLESGQ